MNTIRVAIILSGLLAVGCGGRTAINPPDAATNSNGNNNNSVVQDAGPQADAAVDAAVRPDGAVTQCTEDEQCVVAIRTDNCCEAAYPELRTTVQADPCLTRWPIQWDRVPQTCMDAWDPECDYIDCMPAPPQWRTAGCNQGGCMLRPECESASDCTLALDTRKCCPCPEAVPPLLIAQDPCFVSPQGGNAPQWCYPTACPEMPCEACRDNDPPQCNTEQQVCWDEQQGW